MEYAERRTKEHLLRFTQLYEMVKKKLVHSTWLGEVEAKDNLFPKLDCRVYRSDYEFSWKGGFAE